MFKYKFLSCECNVSVAKGVRAGIVVYMALVALMLLVIGNK